MPEVVTTEHSIYYQTAVEVTPRALADSLLGLDGLAEHSAAILAAIMPTLDAGACELLIRRIEIASYKESFLFRLVFGKGRKAEKKVEELRNALKLDTMNTKVLVGFAFSAALAYAAQLWLKPNDPAKIHIEQSFNSIGREMNITPQQVLELVQAAVGGKTEDLKRAGVRITHPGGEKRTGRITIDEKEGFGLSPEAVQVFPVDYQKPEPEETFNDCDNVQIVFRAADLDDPTKGWAAVIAEVSEKRLPVHLSSDIDPTRVPIGKYVVGDVTVIYKPMRGERKQPRLVMVRRLHLSEEQAASLR